MLPVARFLDEEVEAALRGAAVELAVPALPLEGADPLREFGEMGGSQLLDGPLDAGQPAHTVIQAESGRGGAVEARIGI